MIRIVALLGLVALSSDTAVSAPMAPNVYRVSFPKLSLAPDEQIPEFTVSVDCGHIERLNHIPDDWNVEVTRAFSAVEVFHASAGHGISYLRQLDVFAGSLEVRVVDNRCFSVSASVVATFDTDRTIRLGAREVRLSPVRTRPDKH